VSSAIRQDGRASITLALSVFSHMGVRPVDLNMIPGDRAGTHGLRPVRVGSWSGAGWYEPSRPILTFDGRLCHADNGRTLLVASAPLRTAVACSVCDRPMSRHAVMLVWCGHEAHAPALSRSMMHPTCRASLWASAKGKSKTVATPRLTVARGRSSNLLGGAARQHLNPDQWLEMSAIADRVKHEALTELNRRYQSWSAHRDAPRKARPSYNERVSLRDYARGVIEEAYVKYADAPSDHIARVLHRLSETEGAGPRILALRKEWLAHCKRSAR
jgi:hypothetical protein